MATPDHRSRSDQAHPTVARSGRRHGPGARPRRAGRPGLWAGRVAVMVSVALVVAACSSADDTTDGAGATTDGDQTTAVAPPAPSTTGADGSGQGAQDGGDPAAQGASSTTRVVAPPTISSTSAPPQPVAPVDLPHPNSAPEMAAALSEAELAVRQTTATAEERAAWGQRQQQLYRLLSGHEDWVDEVVAGVDPAVSTAVAGNWAARVELDALLKQHRLSDTLPAWRIDEPLPADELLGYYCEAGERHGVPWEILAAINLIETRMGRINGISTAGAQGPMQFLPTTWAECCEGDPTVDRDAINGAAKYLIDRGGATNLDRAIFGYNNSDHYVAAVTGYAAVLADDPEAYYGYHGWQVYFASTAGLALLPEGYREQEPVDAATWFAANPDGRLTIDD